MPRRPLTKEETEEMNKLCSQIAIEKDHLRFAALVERLNNLLAVAGHPLDVSPLPKSRDD
jgi:hypothetical protein